MRLTITVEDNDGETITSGIKIFNLESMNLKHESRALIISRAVCELEAQIREAKLKIKA